MRDIVNHNKFSNLFSTDSLFIKLYESQLSILCCAKKQQKRIIYCYLHFLQYLIRLFKN